MQVLTTLYEDCYLSPFIALTDGVMYMMYKMHSAASASTALSLKSFSFLTLPLSHKLTLQEFSCVFLELSVWDVTQIFSV